MGVSPRIYQKNEIIELLSMPYAEFESTVMREAKQLHREVSNTLHVTAMLGCSNICRCQCLYCGMRAGNAAIKRYRLSGEDIAGSAKLAKSQGIDRFFIISGEDPKFPFDDMLSAVAEIKKLGMFVSLAVGELEQSQYDALKAAGADEYVMKFEMSDPDDFDRLNPSTNFAARMAAIERVKKSGMLLASGDIVGYPGHSIDKLADDILLTASLGVSWAPCVPFTPAANTPCGTEPRGDYTLNLRQISILRLMLPDIRITAQQPGEDLRDGLGGRQGNLAALNAGADILFTDMLSAALQREFSVMDNRVLGSLQHIKSLAAENGMTTDLSC